MPAPLCVPGVRERSECRGGKVTRPSVGTEGRTMWWREEEGKEEKSEDRGKGRKLSEWQSGFREGCGGRRML